MVSTANPAKAPASKSLMTMVELESLKSVSKMCENISFVTYFLTYFLTYFVKNEM